MTPGQLIYEAFADQFPGETWGPWEDVIALPMGEGHGWEKVAQAVLDDAFPGLREQVRLAREDRDQLRKQLLSLAAEYGDATEGDVIEGHVTGSLYMALRAEVLNDAAVRLREIAGPPS
jgi:hypothetical protein